MRSTERSLRGGERAGERRGGAIAWWCSGGAEVAQSGECRNDAESSCAPATARATEDVNAPGVELARVVLIAIFHEPLKTLHGEQGSAHGMHFLCGLQCAK